MELRRGEIPVGLPSPQSFTSKETQFQEEDRGPGLTFYSAVPVFHSEGDKNLPGTTRCESHLRWA